MEFRDTVAIVLGGAGGIGRAVASLLSEQGAKIAIVSRNRDRAQAVADALAPAGAPVLPVEADPRDAEQVEKLFERVSGELGEIRAVAHCVGSLVLKPAHLTAPVDWRETIDTNLLSACYVVRSAGKWMAANGGSVALASSAAARLGIANHEAIAAAKAGVIGLTLSAAATYASKRIRFNCVAPGLTRTPMTERLFANESARNSSLAMHPLGALGEPEDVARAIVWLLHPQQTWVTGQVLGVDGGLGSLLPRGGGR